MKAYIAYLERLRLEVQHAREETRDVSQPPPPSLDQQITTLMQTLPPAVRDRPWAIKDLVNRLEGIHNEHPHPQGVGQALQRLGWKRVRPDNKVGMNRRLWIPPEIRMT